MHYFEILDIKETETNTEAIDAAYNQARLKWQTVLSQGVGEQQKLARTLMDGQLDEIYATLRDPIRREQYQQELELFRTTGIPIGSQRAKVSFSLHGGYSDHEFVVVENPVRHPLEQDGLMVESLQEYVCRAWENPSWALAHLEDRTLPRWIHYAAAQHDIVTAMDYLRWENPARPPENLLQVALDLMQTKYPAPILPRSPSDLVTKLPSFKQPQWRVSPRMINFGVVAKAKDAQTVVQIRWWQEEPSELTAEAEHPAIQLDTSKLETEHVLGIAVDLDAIERGMDVDAVVKIACQPYGAVTIPVLATKAKRILGNKELRTILTKRAGDIALRIGDHVSATEYLRMADRPADAAKAEIKLIQQAYSWHDWQQVVDMSRRFHDRYGRVSTDVQIWQIEALRMLCGSIYQVKAYRRSVEYLASLAHETSHAQGLTQLAESWTAQPSAQLEIDIDDPKLPWVVISEFYDLNWTHPNGRANRSNYAGEIPLDLSDRRVIWRTHDDSGKKSSADNISIQAPLIASRGMLIGRTRYPQHIVALDAASGAHVWSFDEGMDGVNLAIPVAGEGSIFVANQSGGLFALDALSGTVLWHVNLGESRDADLAYEQGVLCVGTGKRFILLEADSGKEIVSLDNMRSNWGDANPVNLMVTNSSYLFQKVGGRKVSMVFINPQKGKAKIEIEIPFFKKSFLGALFGDDKKAAITWAAWGDYVIMPMLVTQELAVYHEGSSTERHQWDELHLFAFKTTSSRPIDHLMEIVKGKAYGAGRGAEITVKEVKAANACAITPVLMDRENGNDVLMPFESEHTDQLLIAAAFDQTVHYWTLDDGTLERAKYRIVDGPVQSIAFLGLYDMVTTQTSLTTSFVGKVDGGNATSFVFPKGFRDIKGAPAIYGDLLYVTTKDGEVAAIGR